MNRSDPTNDTQQQAQLLTVRELCSQFKFSRDWVYRRTRGGAADPLPCVRLGRSIRFEPNHVQRYLESHREVDASDKLAGTDGIARVKARRYRAMARKRFQKGYVRLRGKRDPYWEGFYRENILLPDGKVQRKQRSVNLGRKKDLATKRLAERKLQEKLRELNDLDYQPRSVITVKDFVEQKYLKLSLPCKKETTRHGYRVILRKHVLAEFGERQLSEVTKEDVQEFINRKAASGLSWTTVRNIKWVLSAVFTAAIKYGYCRSNPARSAELPPDSGREMQPLPSDKELDDLGDALEEPYQTMVWLARTTGVRVGELLALRWRSIDWKKKCLRVEKTVHNGQEQTPKTHRSRRPVRLDDEQLARLSQYRQRTPQVKESDWLFPSKHGKAPLRADNVLERVIRPAVKKLGISRVTWHLLRHWHTSALIEEGVPVKVVQERLGHSRSDTTMEYYLHVSNEQHEKAAEAITRRLRKSRESPESTESVSACVSEFEAVEA